MSELNRTPLEEQLEHATRWEGPASELWSKALAAETGAANNRFQTILTVMRRPSSILAACLALGLFGVIIMALNAPVARRVGYEKSVQGGFSITEEQARTTFNGGGERHRAPPPSPPPANDVKAEGTPPDVAARVVIRKATIEIESPDVRAAFAKAAMLVSDAGSEFVQESSLTGGAPGREPGSHDPFYGTLTLRVGVKRLSEVLNRLRELGTVVSETSGGEDVTDQAVDLDARLRNEQRVETELLELMSSRKDSPLKEILEVREQIGSVRERIERLTAQRDRLSQLASLATVLVIIREPNASDPRAAQDRPVGGYFTDRMAAAWRNGLVTLSDSISWIVGVIVGGALWWIVVAVIAVALIRVLRRPAPPKA